MTKSHAKKTQLILVEINYMQKKVWEEGWLGSSHHTASFHQLNLEQITFFCNMFFLFAIKQLSFCCLVHENPYRFSSSSGCMLHVVAYYQDGWFLIVAITTRS